MAYAPQLPHMRRFSFSALSKCMKSLHVRHAMAEGTLLDEHQGEKKLSCIAVLFFREASMKY